MTSRRTTLATLVGGLAPRASAAAEKHYLYAATPGIRNYIEYGGVGVIVDPARRRALIEEQIAALCRKTGLQLHADEALLDEPADRVAELLDRAERAAPRIAAAAHARSGQAEGHVGVLGIRDDEGP